MGKLDSPAEIKRFSLKPREKRNVVKIKAQPRRKLLFSLRCPTPGCPLVTPISTKTIHHQKSNLRNGCHKIKASSRPYSLLFISSGTGASVVASFKRKHEVAKSAIPNRFGVSTLPGRSLTSFRTLKDTRHSSAATSTTNSQNVTQNERLANWFY